MLSSLALTHSDTGRTRNSVCIFISAIAETHKNAGNDAFSKHDFVEAINLYTNRASAHYHLGKVSFILTLCNVDIVLYSVSNIPLSILHPGPFT